MRTSRRLGSVLAAAALSLLTSGTTYAQHSWTWQVVPAHPTSQDTIRIDMSFYSNYAPFFQSSHVVAGYQASVDVNVCAGMLPIIGWFAHSETIGRLPAGTYSLLIQVDRGDWNAQFGQCVMHESYSASGSFVVQDSTSVEAATWSRIRRLFRD